jgi:hypothetical protein
MIFSIAAARIIPALVWNMIFRMAATRIIPELGRILYDLQNGCCQDHSCVSWNMIVRIAAAKDHSCVRRNMIFKMAAARIIHALGGILYDLQYGCCQDHSCVSWNMIVRIAAAKDHSCVGKNMIFRMAAARTIPALDGILYDLRNGWVLPGPFLRQVKYDLQYGCCQDHSGIRWNMIFRTRVLPGSFLR